jgi:hypothetical protein
LKKETRKNRKRNTSTFYERGREAGRRIRLKNTTNKEVRWKRDKPDQTQVHVNKEQQQVKIWLTLAGIVGVHVVSRPA